MRRRASTFCLAALWLGLAACDPPRDAVAPTLPPGNPVRQPLDAPQRPEVVRTFPLDYGELPFMLTAGVQAGDRSATIAFLSDTGKSEPRTAILEGMVAEIEAEGLRIFTPLSGANLPEVQRLPGTAGTLCPSENQNGKPNPGVPRPPPQPAGAQRSITWEGIRTKTWAKDYIDYVRYEGTMELGSCRASATRSAVVRAKAIVPGLLYGFRTCVPVCDAPPKLNDAPVVGREEMLVLIGPRAVWAGSSVPWASLQTNPHIGSFSRIVVPLKRGGAASAFINVEEHELNRFIDARLAKASEVPRRNLPVTQLGVDVTWLEGDGAPIGLGMVSSVAQPGPQKSAARREDVLYSFDD